MGALSFLLDTCALIWWWNAPDKLSGKVRALVRDPRNRIFVSAATAWEISTKTRIGTLPSGLRILAEWEQRIGEDGFIQLPIRAAHASKAGLLPGDHRDPFDRMIAAQGLLEGMPVLTRDPLLAGLGAETRW